MYSQKNKLKPSLSDVKASNEITIESSSGENIAVINDKDIEIAWRYEDGRMS